jgi:hypothetical protein
MKISFVSQTNFFRLSAARAVLVLLLAAAPKFLAAGASPRWPFFGAGASVASHPALVEGSVFWGSGFGRAGFGGVPNNKFYAFTRDGK